MAQPENATESIILTVSGTVVILSELQSLNAPNGIFLIAKEKVTSVRFEQLENAYCSILQFISNVKAFSKFGQWSRSDLSLL